MLNRIDINVIVSYLMKFTKHFIAMMSERRIRSEWVDSAVGQPDQIENRDDGTRHYLKKIEAQDSRWLRVVVNIAVEPHKAVTVFFDRRIEEMKHENHSG